MGKLIDLTGKRFGNLVVIERAENYKDGRSKWKCKCDCGNVIDAMSTNLLRGNTKSCGCVARENSSKSKTKDLTGNRYGKLVVIKKSSRRGKNSYWLCRCDCGVEKEICATALKHGQSSCGCAAFDFIKYKVIGNKYYTDSDNVVHVELRDGEEMLCDPEDWESLKCYTWRKNKWGYANAKIKNKDVRFHVKILGRKEGYVIDHIDRNKLNNQKVNLRFLTKSGNAINSKDFENNTSGTKGVCKTKRGKWIASITLNQKRIHLGTYDNIEDAINARKQAEDKYFAPILQSK